MKKLIFYSMYSFFHYVRLFYVSYFHLLIDNLFSTVIARSRSCRGQPMWVFFSHQWLFMLMIIRQLSRFLNISSNSLYVTFKLGYDLPYSIWFSNTFPTQTESSCSLVSCHGLGLHINSLTQCSSSQNLI